MARVATGLGLLMVLWERPSGRDQLRGSMIAPLAKTVNLTVLQGAVIASNVS
jgi:hypothetical protein